MEQQIQDVDPQPAKTAADACNCPAAKGVSNHNSRARESLRGAALRSAIRKRADGVPTYTVAEAAALFSVSQEYLYRVIHAGGFPAVRMRIGGNQGRYVVPAKAVEQMLDHAAGAGECVEVAEWSQEWRGSAAGRSSARLDESRARTGGGESSWM